MKYDNNIMKWLYSRYQYDDNLTPESRSYYLKRIHSLYEDKTHEHIWHFTLK